MHDHGILDEDLYLLEYNSDNTACNHHFDELLRAWMKLGFVAYEQPFCVDSVARQLGTGNSCRDPR